MVSKVQIIKYFVLIRNSVYVNYKHFMKYRNINKKIIFLETLSMKKQYYKFIKFKSIVLPFILKII